MSVDRLINALVCITLIEMRAAVGLSVKYVAIGFSLNELAA